MKRAAEITTTTRRSYVQSSLLFGAGGGIQLADLRDLVAATADYDEFSRVILTQQKVEVIETKATPWRNVGRISQDAEPREVEANSRAGVQPLD